MGTFDQCIVKPGTKVDLTRIDPKETFGWTKAKAAEQTQKNWDRITVLQELLYAEKKRGVVFAFQAMDAGGKDGTIRKLGGAVNPAGTRVISFKVPTEEEKKRGFLWRVEIQMPKAGELVMLNRSHYEDVCVVRVHNLVPEKVWRERYGQINDFEKKLAQPTAEMPEGTHMLKFFLHISKDEQWSRLRERLEDPAKQWKLTESDFKERQYWDKYMEAYSDALTNCTTAEAPWIIIPSDHKWMRDLIISQIVADYMEGLNMQLPKPSVDIEEIRKKYFSNDPSQPKKPSGPKAHFNEEAANETLPRAGKHLAAKNRRMSP